MDGLRMSGYFLPGSPSYRRQGAHHRRTASLPRGGSTSTGISSSMALGVSTTMAWALSCPTMTAAASTAGVR